VKVVKVRKSSSGFDNGDGQRRVCVGCRVEMRDPKSKRKKASTATWLVLRKGAYVHEVAYCDEHWKKELGK